MHDRSPAAFLRLSATALLTAVVLAQDPPRDADTARLGLETVHVLPLDGKALPVVEMLGFRTSLDRLCFQGDGTRLFLSTLAGHDKATRRSLYRLDAVDVASGKAAAITPENGAQCLGASPRGPLLFDGSTLAAPAEPQWQPLTVPDRTDAFLSPYAPLVVLCTLDRTVRTRLVDLATGKGPDLRLGGHHASAVAFAPNGRIAIARALFTEGGGQTSEGIRVVDAKGELVRDLPPATRGITTLAFAAAGEQLVWVDDRLHLMALADDKELASTDDTPRFWADLGAHAAVSHDGRTVRLHNPATLARVKEFPLRADVAADAPPKLQQLGGVLATAVSNDGTMLAVATYDAVTVFRIKKG